MIGPAPVQKHGASAKALEVVFHPGIVEGPGFGQDPFQRVTQVGNVPLTFAKIRAPPSLRFVPPDLEGLTEGTVHPFDDRIGGRLQHRLKAGLDMVAARL